MFIIRVEALSGERVIKPSYVGETGLTTIRSIARKWSCDVQASFALAYWKSTLGPGLTVRVARSG